MTNGANFNFNNAVRLSEAASNQEVADFQRAAAEQMQQNRQEAAADKKKAVKTFGWLAVGGVVLGIGTLVLAYFLIRGLIRAGKKK